MRRIPEEKRFANRLNLGSTPRLRFSISTQFPFASDPERCVGRGAEFLWPYRSAQNTLDRLPKKRGGARNFPARGRQSKRLAFAISDIQSSREKPKAQPLRPFPPE